jgi:hypothetical protein
MIGGVIHSLCKPVIHVYPEIAAQGKELPLATYTVSSIRPEHSMHQKPTIDKVSYQISVRAKTYDAAEAIAASLRSLLDRYSGTVDGMQVTDFRIDDMGDLFNDDPAVWGKYIKGSFWLKY